jgi:hypothetical protein
MKSAESNRKKAPVLVDNVFPIFFITKSMGNCKAMEKSWDREVMETICAAVKFFTRDKNNVSIAI